MTVDGLEFCVDTVSKEATLVTGSYRYSGDIKVPEKITDDGVEYTVTALGDECFSYCSGLTSITIPSSVTRLGYSCFEDCTALTSIDIPSSVTSLGSSCFSRCTGLRSIDIPSIVTSLPDMCFYDCTGLTSIDIPSSVTSLGDNCFNLCTELRGIDIPSSVTSLGDGCFYGCTGLRSIDIPSTVTSLEDGCFYGCTGLTSIDIPSTVTSLGKQCFYGCTGLLSIICENPNPPSVGFRAFEDDTYSNSTLYVPGVAAYQAADGWQNFKNIKKIATDDISAAKMRGVVVAAEGGIVTVSGLSDGAKVEFFSIDGKLIGAEKANSGTASIKTSEHAVICKVGRKNIKILVK